MAKKEMTFEASMERLEEVLRLLENGNESLDASLALYEEGIALIRACNEKLEKAEQKIKILQMQEDGSICLTDFVGTEQ
jgi:exodeoxyribonuclease VII small subunit